jgi:hypothetical protein
LDPGLSRSFSMRSNLRCAEAYSERVLKSRTGRTRSPSGQNRLMPHYTGGRPRLFRCEYTVYIDVATGREKLGCKLNYVEYASAGVRGR